MPPKKAGQVPNKKTVEKKKEKIIEDKTFGIKNKKGRKQQTYIKQVTNQVKYGGGQSIAKREADVYQQKKEKLEKEKEKAAMDALFRPTQQVQKISAGADPKSVLCLFFKQGQCSKGDKCKFSHDLSLENKAEKRSMYIDSRDTELQEDTIDKWDTDKLEQVVNKKHAAKARTKTDIVCKHFLHAIEKGIYGWFWECPSGGDKCIYRHALPPGFVLKKFKKEQEELQPQDTITLEELVEKQREALASSGKSLTKVTLESFLAWKKRKLKEKSDKVEKELAKKKEAFKQGKTLGISGREMFLFNPDLVGGDDEDEEGGDVIQVEREDSDTDEGVVDVTDMIATNGGTEAVQSKGETSGDAVDSNGPTRDSGAVDTMDEEGVAVRGASEEMEEVAVDEGLFQEDFDDIPPIASATEQNTIPHEPSNPAHVGVLNEEVAVDESLFDIENLQDLNLDDPAILGELPES